MIAIIDYDAGNIKSVEKALEALGEKAVVTRDQLVIKQADGVILPGVGAFGDAMNKLHSYELTGVIQDVISAGIPFLGICLGLQLLFKSSEENPGVEGLGILQGKIVRFPENKGVKIPHIGWNSLTFPNSGRLFKGIPENSYVYFVHSFYLLADDAEIVTAQAEYGVQFHASVEHNNVFACQFHPEKSSEAGLSILRNFAAVTKEGVR